MYLCNIYIYISIYIYIKIYIYTNRQGLTQATQT